VPAINSIEAVIAAAREARLTADGHQQLAIAISQVLTQLEAAGQSVPELERRRLRIERLEQQLRNAGLEPEEGPPVENDPQSKPLRAVGASESESVEG
jgi:hypothetical protein